MNGTITRPRGGSLPQTSARWAAGIAGAVAALALAGPAGAQAPPGAPEPPAGALVLPSTTPGETPQAKAEAMLLDLVPPLPEGSPAPAADPHNLEGTWVHDQLFTPRIAADMYGRKLPLNAKGQAVLARRLAAEARGQPYANASSKCLPPGAHWQFDLNFPFRIFQTPARLEAVVEQPHGTWTVLMNETPADPGARSYMGRSVGHWDGDTLVVETTNFKLGLWLDAMGTPASPDAKLIQRVRKVHSGEWFLEIAYTIEDPVYYTRPWSWVRTYAWRPNMRVFKEFNCELQIGDRENPADVGLAQEPSD